jgi:hypothetical protein
MQMEFEFTLPRGYVDDNGVVHQHGAMRLATALDEIAPLRDPRVRNNEAYLVVILLAQVITRLGTLPSVTPNVIERLFAVDMAFLQALYRQLNDVELPHIEAVCPNCGHDFQVEVPPLGEL